MHRPPLMQEGLHQAWAASPARLVLPTQSQRWAWGKRAAAEFRDALRPAIVFSFASQSSNAHLTQLQLGEVAPNL